MQELPKIEVAKLSFIKPITLLNFGQKFSNLKNSKFSFLSSSKEYSQYYIDLEGSYNDTKTYDLPLYIDQVGNLKPLTRKHTLNSYWQRFRRKVKDEGLSEENKDLFLLLPLKIQLPITTIKANNTIFPVDIFVHLFPFGVCCFNMNVSIKGKSYNFDEFIDLTSKISRANISKVNLTFDKYAELIANKINESIFGMDDNLIKKFPTHIFTFIKKTSHLLRFDPEERKDHMTAIVACMKKKPVKDVSTINFDSISKTLTDSQLTPRRKLELLFFESPSSFMYPSSEWIEYLDKKGSEILEEKLNCMHDNYQSVFNLLFSINRSINDCLINNKDNIPSDKMLELVNCFYRALPSDDPESCRYYNFVSKHISEKLMINKSIIKIESK